MDETYLEKLKKIREKVVMEDTEIIPIHKKLYFSANRILEYVYDRMCEQAKNPEIKYARESFKIYGADINPNLIHALTALNPEESEEQIRKKVKAITSQHSITMLCVTSEQYKEIFEVNNDKVKNCISIVRNKNYIVFVSENTLERLAEQEGISVSFSGLGANFTVELPPYTFETKLKLMKDNHSI